ncbi:MAG: hypothetical protein PW788_10455 [Micavibrio sp.]|nr:hypothetical protein [Micavibrio sp.]
MVKLFFKKHRVKLIAAFALLWPCLFAPVLMVPLLMLGDAQGLAGGSSIVRCLFWMFVVSPPAAGFFWLPFPKGWNIAFAIAFGLLYMPLAAFIFVNTSLVAMCVFARACL